MSQEAQGRRIALSFGDYALDVAPQLGGAVTGLRWRGTDLLRPTPDAAQHAIETAAFPLAPYANRIAHGRFAFDGRDVRLERNRADQKHPLHGSAWLGAWQCEDVSGARIVLSCRFARSDWPWRFSCRQEISIDGEGARFALAVRNDDDTPMPLSFGCHPFFPRLPGAILRAQVQGVWRSDAELVPVRFDTTVDLPGLAEGASLDAAPFVDHCHGRWSGEATLSWPGLDVRMTASPDFGFLHLYIPERQSFLCVEPVSAIPNAVNHADPRSVGLRVLAPGEEASGWVRIAAAETSR